MKSKLLEPYSIRNMPLSNRIVMAPMTRGRAENKDLVPESISAEYYKQRASAGLIITEGTWVSPEAISFINVPGIFNDAQKNGWKKVTEAVHEAGGKIFLQLGHSGAVSHPDLLNNALPKGPSAINPQERVFTPDGFKMTETPLEMSLEDIEKTILDYAIAAIRAKSAGFDGVEVHGAHVFLIPSFLNSSSNKRTDQYGGSVENRSRFALDVLRKIIDIWGPGKVGFKISPATKSGIFDFNDTTEETYKYLVSEINKLPLAYLHILGPQQDVSGTPAAIYKDVAAYFRPLYKGTLIVGGGYTKESGEQALKDGNADLIAYGVPFIANPDLPKKFEKNIPLRFPDQATFYSGGAKGYIDYPIEEDFLNKEV